MMDVHGVIHHNSAWIKQCLQHAKIALKFGNHPHAIQTMGASGVKSISHAFQNPFRVQHADRKLK